LDTKSNDDREAKRAGVYGLNLTDLLGGSVVVAPGTYARLSSVESKSRGPGLVRLTPNSLDDVKRWIGVPDELGAKRCSCATVPAEIPAIANADDFRKLDHNSRLAVHDLAYEYVHGDSRRLAAYKPWLDHLVADAAIHGVFFREDIDIHRGAVLEIGKDLKVLFARNIRIWRGGLLKITGPVKIDCVSIVGNLLDISQVFSALPEFAVVQSMEAFHG
jgi:hypothetical protein